MSELGPLARAERKIANHLLELERRLDRLHEDRTPSEIAEVLWVRYVQAADTYARILDRLRPLPPPSSGRR